MLPVLTLQRYRLDHHAPQCLHSIETDLKMGSAISSCNASITTWNSIRKCIVWCAFHLHLAPNSVQGITHQSCKCC